MFFSFPALISDGVELDFLFTELNTKAACSFERMFDSVLLAFLFPFMLFATGNLATGSNALRASGCIGSTLKDNFAAQAGAFDMV